MRGSPFVDTSIITAKYWVIFCPETLKRHLSSERQHSALCVHEKHSVFCRFLARVNVDFNSSTKKAVFRAHVIALFDPLMGGRFYVESAGNCFFPAHFASRRLDVQSSC